MVTNTLKLVLLLCLNHLIRVTQSWAFVEIGDNSAGKCDTVGSVVDVEHDEVSSANIMLGGHTKAMDLINGLAHGMMRSFINHNHWAIQVKGMPGWRIIGVRDDIHGVQVSHHFPVLSSLIVLYVKNS